MIVMVLLMEMEVMIVKARMVIMKLFKTFIIGNCLRGSFPDPEK